jgi:Arm DNA-binding domain
MTIKLTKRGIDTIRPTGRALITYDTELKGFGVRIGATGTLSWFVEYRPGAGGRRVAKRRMVLGSRELTPEQARAAAKEVLANVALGKDPAASLQREREMSTFREFAHRYLREEAAQKLKPGTAVINSDLIFSVIFKPPIWSLLGCLCQMSLLALMWVKTATALTTSCDHFYGWYHDAI